MTAAGREIPMDLNAASKNRWATTHREPVGVVLAISAFNHPLNLIVHQAVTAVAAGCPVLVKPALSTPMSARSLVEMLHEAGLPKEHCQLVLTENELTGRLVEDPRVAYLSFIGSSEVGWRLRSRLARGARAALEHGGVAPAILDETADLDDALPLLVKAGYYHAGQVCVSLQRIYLPRSALRGFVERFAERVEKLCVGDPTLDATEVGPLISPREVGRVESWVKGALDGGGRLACGGRRLGETCYAPTVVVDPPDDCELSEREIFGPVVAVYGYHDIDEAVLRANAPTSYFQASLFTGRLDRALDIARRLNGTTVLVNDHTAFRVDWMPFGGHRDSGLGTGGIGYSIDDMTLERSIIFRRPG
jgi:acyl-CoA reductase-like NAD-dependent aldehyde dehydrogenase